MSTIDLYYYYLFLIYGKYYKYALFFHVHAIYFLENQLLGWLGHLQAANY